MTDTVLTFDFKYKEAYTSTIEFDTQINEKHKGKEQRYPKWTYPKRTFTLKFDKNFTDRKAIEEFFIDVMLNGGKFNWTWETETGGNGKTYLCFFEEDKLKQNIKNLGYTDFNITFACIDNSPVQSVGAFNFYHDAECENSIGFYRIIDSVFTAANNMKVWWDKPKKSWTLKFDKDPQTRKNLEEFFIAKRGRFRSFDWTWEASRGGDGLILIIYN